MKGQTEGITSLNVISIGLILCGFWLVPNHDGVAFLLLLIAIAVNELDGRL